jgi:glycosyltransferase involved in cell wall biosynthesis
LSASATALVSAIVPAFNAERTIRETLATIQMQTHPTLEILVVDDGSNDDTARIVQEIAEGDSRVRLIISLNRGPAAARNLAIEHACGEFIAPLDSDDLWHPQYVEAQLGALLAAGPETGFAYALHRTIDLESRVVRDFPAFGCHGRVFLQHLLINFVGNGSAALFRRAAIAEVGGYDARLQVRGAEDYLLTLRIAARRGVAVVPRYLVGYRKRPDSLSSAALGPYRAKLFAFEAASAGAGAPSWVRDWVEADAALVAGVRLAQAKKWPSALAFILRAGGKDAASTLLDLAARAANRWPGRPRAAWSQCAGVSFVDAPCDQAAYRSPSKLVARRLARLAALDNCEAITSPR